MSLSRHDTDPEEPQEKPLDPASERLQERMKSLVRLSSLIMAGGMLAVFSVILYRVVNGGETAPTAAARITVPSAAGDKIVSATPDGNRMVLLVEAGDGIRTAVVVDLATGAVTSRVTLGPDTAIAVPPPAP